MDEQLEALITLYQVWLKDNGLSLGSADEHLFDEGLTEAQRDWLGAFCRIWELSARNQSNSR